MIPYTGPSLVEQCYDEIIDFVTGANLTAKCTDYTSRSTDGIVLRPPIAVLVGDYELSQLRADQFPGVIVKPGTVTVNPENEVFPLGVNLYIFEISIWMAIKGDIQGGKEILQTQCFRYNNAFQDIIDDPRIVPDSNHPAIINAIRRVVAFDYHRTIQAQQYLMMATFIDFKVKAQFRRGENAPSTGA